MRGLSLTRSPCSGLRNAKTGALVATLDGDAEIVEWSHDGALLLTRDPVGIHRLRETGTWKARAAFGPSYSAFFSPGGDFVYADGNGSLQMVRTADGEQLFQAIPIPPAKHGVSFTPSGLFEADDAELPLVKYRLGGVIGGRWIPWNEARPDARRENLMAAFFAGTPMPK